MGSRKRQSSAEQSRAQPRMPPFAQQLDPPPTESESVGTGLRTVRYADGRHRPFYRGWLHGAVAILLVYSVIHLTLMVIQRRISLMWIKLLATLGAKLMSYGASAMLHLFPAKSLLKHNALLIVDLTAITVAMWAPANAFYDGLQEWLLGFGIMVFVTAVNFHLCSRQIMDNQSPILRVIVLLAYFFWITFFIGSRYGFKDFWISGVAFYCLGFLVSPPMHRFLGPAPWHRASLNSWHEDFHCLLALADFSFLLMSIRFMLRWPIVPAK